MIIALARALCASLSLIVVAVFSRMCLSMTWIRSRWWHSHWYKGLTNGGWEDNNDLAIRLCFYFQWTSHFNYPDMDCSNISSVIHTLTSLLNIAGGLMLNELLILCTEYTERCSWSRHTKAPRSSPTYTRRRVEVQWSMKESRLRKKRGTNSLINCPLTGLEATGDPPSRLVLGSMCADRSDWQNGRRALDDEKTSMSWNLSLSLSSMLQSLEVDNGLFYSSPPEWRWIFLTLSETLSWSSRWPITHDLMRAANGFYRMARNSID